MRSEEEIKEMIKRIERGRGYLFGCPLCGERYGEETCTRALKWVLEEK